jgi:DNA-binding GntR family transcriptional regulator
MSGEVRQGSFLRLDRLAGDLGISSTPVREALAALEHEGFVRREPRRGYIVSRFSRQDLLDVFVVEAFVGAELAARASRRMTTERLDELHRVYDEMVSFIRADLYDEADDALYRFSWLLHDAARSPKLAWLVGTIVPYSPHGYAAIEEFRLPMIDGYWAVLRSLDDGDEGGARVAMEAHIRASGDRFVDYFERIGLWSEQATREPADDTESEPPAPTAGLRPPPEITRRAASG